jgi:hypothetical protein
MHVLFFLGPFRVQTFSLISQREPMVSLNGPWRFHIGDDTA